MRTAVACPEPEPEPAARPPVIVVYTAGGFITTTWTGPVWLGPPPPGLTTTTVWRFVGQS